MSIGRIYRIHGIDMALDPNACADVWLNHSFVQMIYHSVGIYELKIHRKMLQSDRQLQFGNPRSILYSRFSPVWVKM